MHYIISVVQFMYEVVVLNLQILRLGFKFAFLLPFYLNLSVLGLDLMDFGLKL